MTQRLYQLPDILVIHIKRFNMTARFREKIRAKVIYPIKSLDMSPYCVRLDNADSSSSSDVYDLYGVSNHIGVFYDSFRPCICNVNECRRKLSLK